MSADRVRQYYERVPETGRFDGPMGRLEFERSKRIISRFLSKTPMQIVDVGAGVGAYSFWLSRMGHFVSAVEPSDGQFQLIRQQTLMGSSAHFLAVSSMKGTR